MSSPLSSSSPEAANADRISPTVCYLCRQRKTKCNRRLPRCGFCIKAKADCQYVERPKKRGLRAGYVSELESRLEKLEQDFEDFKRLRPHAEPQASTPDVVTASTAPTSTVLTPLSGPSPPIGLRNQDIAFKDSGSAVSDLQSLPRSYFYTLADSWFKETQTWAPILSQQQIQTALDNLPSPVDCIPDIVLRAVIALQIAYSSQAICLGYNGRWRLSSYLRSQVLVDAMAKPSSSSLQALLIIALLDYGSDDIPSTFSILAIIRRMGENIGIFRQLLKRIEGESPAQVGPPARETYGDESTIALTWCILALDAASSLGVPWRDVSAGLVDHLSSVAYISTPDFRDSFRTHTHLAAIGLQPAHEFFHSFYRQAPQSVSGSLQACDEIYQNLMSYVHGLPETSYTLLADGAVDFDPCHMFTQSLSHGTIIMIYQRFVFDGEPQTAELARERCLQSCSAIINVIRNVSDADAELTSPLFATLLYVAARVKLVMYRGLSQPREPLFDVLMHGINMCGRRWAYARRLDIVLRAAIAEVDTEFRSSLPTEFWDLTKSHLDISEISKEWAEGLKPSLFVGSINGPYV